VAGWQRYVRSDVTYLNGNIQRDIDERTEIGIFGCAFVGEGGEMD
jgi:hypothetical protein